MCNLLIKIGLFLDIDYDKNSNKADLKTYQGLVRKLKYLACSIKPNILFIVDQHRKHSSDPQVGYMQIAKQVV